MSSLLEISFIFPQQKIANRKKLLRFAASKIEQTHLQLDAEEIFNQLNHREKLGNTGIGEGVAIPHCRLNNIDDINRDMIALFISLETAIDYNAFDQKPINMAFVLIALGNNQNLHIKTLSSIAQLVSTAETRNQLSTERDPRRILELLQNL